MTDIQTSPWSTDWPAIDEGLAALGQTIDRINEMNRLFADGTEHPDPFTQEN